MANIYWNEEKAPETETREALMKELVECTDDAFDIRFGGDGAGKHVAVYVEAASDRRDPYPWKKRLPPKFMGWRVVIIFCPPTYVKEILNWVRGD
jgi:hypothetical protein